MSIRVTNISDLVQRVTGSCLLPPLGSARHGGSLADSESGGEDSDEHCDSPGEVEGEHQQVDAEDEEEKKRREAECWERRKREMRSERLVLEMEGLMTEVFDAVSGVKRAYVALQDAHNPWDPERMRTADVAVVGQLRRLGVLRERYRKSVTCRGGGGGGFAGVGLGVREVVAPYEAAAEELRREVKARETEVENLKERLRCLMGGSDSGGKKGRSLSNKKLSFGAGQGNENAFFLCFFFSIARTLGKLKKRLSSFFSFFAALNSKVYFGNPNFLHKLGGEDCYLKEIWN